MTRHENHHNSLGLYHILQYLSIYTLINCIASVFSIDMLSMTLLLENNACMLEYGLAHISLRHCHCLNWLLYMYSIPLMCLMIPTLLWWSYWNHFSLHICMYIFQFYVQRVKVPFNALQVFAQVLVEDYSAYSIWLM